MTCIQLAHQDRDKALPLIAALLGELRESPDSEVISDLGRLYVDWGKNRHTIFLALDQNQPIGVLTLYEAFAVYANGNYGIINELYVSPEFRSRKVGNRLIAKAIEFGQEKGWCRIDVAAPFEDKWKRTVDFYLREGFKHTGIKLKFML